MLNKIENSIWVSWEKHRRSQSLARKFGVSLFQFQRSNARWLSHPISAIRTVVLLLNKRPKLFFIQNPSAFLTLLAIFLRPYFRYKLIVDAHNAGVYPFEPTHRKYRRIFSFMHRNADLTIVTNSILAKTIEKNGGVAAILPDPLPEFTDCTEIERHNEQFIITYICSYSSDEPYLEVFKAAALLPSEFRIYITGNDSNLTCNDRKLAMNSNVILTGFLSEQDYIAQLCKSDSIMVLTTRPDCMVCGAYEAVSLGKPLILSDSSVLRMYFEKGCIFTNNQTNEIYNAILKMKQTAEVNKMNIVFLKGELIIRWEYTFSKVVDIIENLNR